MKIACRISVLRLRVNLAAFLDDVPELPLELTSGLAYQRLPAEPIGYDLNLVELSSTPLVIDFKEQ